MATPSVVVRALAGLAGLALTSVASLHAQSSGAGFLFGTPPATLTVRGGLGHASAGSDIFSFTTERLTLGRGDFSGPAAGADLSFRLTPRLDLQLSGTYAGSTRSSEFIDWVDQDDQPIEQTTRFVRVPLTAGVRAYLTPRGHSIGQFAWVPARVAPYVGAGGGAMWYLFRQEGDFVDFETLDVFSDRLESQGWTATAHALAGADLTLSPRLALTGEARYAVARARLSNAFDQFDPIDLSGLSATVGLTVRF